jgi:hypothetical protein
MKTKLFQVYECAASLNLSDSLTDIIIKRGLIPTVPMESQADQTMTTLYGSHQLIRISNLLDQGITLSEIENYILH